MTSEGVPGAPDAFPEPGFSGAIAAAWRLYRDALRLLLGPFLLLSAVATALSLGGRALAADLESSPGLQVGLVLFLPVVSFVTAGSIGVAASGPLLADRAAGRRTSFLGAFGASRGRLRNMLAAGLFASLLALCVMAIFTPAVFLLLSPSLFYGPPVVAFAVSLEGVTLQAGLTRARSLLKGSWLRVFGILLTTALGIGLLQVSASQLAVVLPEGGLRDVGFILTQVVSDALLLPFVASISFVVYLDLRARLDDFGLEQLVKERSSAHE